MEYDGPGEITLIVDPWRPILMCLTVHCIFIPSILCFLYTVRVKTSIGY